MERDVVERVEDRAVDLLVDPIEPRPELAGETRQRIVAAEGDQVNALAQIAGDLREGIHLVALGGHDPLTRFTTELTARFQTIHQEIDAAILDALDRITFRDGRLVLPADAVKGPSSTWTYLVNDDPFRNQIGMMLTGPGKATFGIGAALMAMPLMIAWGLIDRVFKRKPQRRS